VEIKSKTYALKVVWATESGRPAAEQLCQIIDGLPRFDYPVHCVDKVLSRVKAIQLNAPRI
jgi:hypothetical protein